MTRNRIRPVLRLVFAILASVSLASVATAGQRRFPDYVYTTAQSIGDAQTVLQSESYLKPGGYQRGTLDPQTTAALREFQNAHLLTSTGQLDRDTMAMLMSHLGARSPRLATGDAAAPRAGASATAPGSTAGRTAAIDRSMPVTGGSMPFPAALGALLLAGGIYLYRRGL